MFQILELLDIKIPSSSSCNCNYVEITGKLANILHKLGIISESEKSKIEHIKFISDSKRIVMVIDKPIIKKKSKLSKKLKKKFKNNSKKLGFSSNELTEILTKRRIEKGLD